MESSPVQDRRSTTAPHNQQRSGARSEGIGGKERKREALCHHFRRGDMDDDDSRRLTSQRVVRRWWVASYSGPCCTSDADRRQLPRTDRERTRRSRTTTTWTGNSERWATAVRGLADRAAGWSWARSCQRRRRRRQRGARRPTAGRWSWNDVAGNWRQTRSFPANSTAPSCARSLSDNIIYKQFRRQLKTYYINVAFSSFSSHHILLIM